MTDAPLEYVPPDEMAELRILLQIAIQGSWKNSSMCQGKHKFPDRTRALATISWGKRQEIHPYHCEICKSWHIGGGGKMSIAKGRQVVVY